MVYLTLAANGSSGRRMKVETQA
nr:MAG: hypothetical protein [Bacteriophage sp.]